MLLESELLSSIWLCWPNNQADISLQIANRFVNILFFSDNSFESYTEYKPLIG